MLSLDFSKKRISNFQEVLDQIQYPEKVKRIDVSGNLLKTLPSNLAKLRNLNSLNLQRNLIQNIEFILEGLGSLPKLKSLQLDNLNDRHVMMLKNRLPRLKKLNGEPVLDRMQILQEQTSPTETLLECINVLFREKDPHYSVHEKMDQELKSRMRDLT